MKTLTRILGIAALFILPGMKLSAGEKLNKILVAETGDIKGTVLDSTGKPISYASIVVMGTGNGANSGDDGSFMIHAINPGTYDVQASFPEYNPQLIRNVVIKPNQTTYLNFRLSYKMGKVVTITTTYLEPVVPKEYSTFSTIPAEQIMRTQHDDINLTITNICSSCSETNDHQLIMRGARAGTVEYVVDGIRQWGTTQVPSQGIEQVTVLSGGIPAEYGDLTGGVIIISTKNYISGMRDSKMMREAILQSKEEEQKAEKKTPAPEKTKKAKKEKKKKNKKEEPETKNPD